MKKIDGFSLVELLVVIVILAVVSGSAIVGLSSVNSRNADSGLEALEGALNYTRYESMSSPNDSVYLSLERLDDKYYARVYKNGNLDKDYTIVSSRFDLFIVVDSSVVFLDDLTVKFDKSTGGFESLHSSLNGDLLTGASNLSLGFSSSSVQLILATKTGRVVLE